LTPEDSKQVSGLQAGSAGIPARQSLPKQASNLPLYFKLEIKRYFFFALTRSSGQGCPRSQGKVACTVTKRLHAVQANESGRDVTLRVDTFRGIFTLLDVGSARHIGCHVKNPRVLFRSIQEP
jgi:hypothetical protein